MTWVTCRSCIEMKREPPCMVPEENRICFDCCYRTPQERQNEHEMLRDRLDRSAASLRDTSPVAPSSRSPVNRNHMILVVLFSLGAVTQGLMLWIHARAGSPWSTDAIMVALCVASAASYALAARERQPK